MDQTQETGLREECGVFGIYDPDGAPVARDLYYGLSALQHRGQEACGIAAADTSGPVGQIACLRGQGLVSEVFHEKELASLPGNLGIGHVRYSTTGGSTPENIQPIVLKYKKGTICLAHNGNLVNTEPLHRQLEETGAVFQTTMDSEIIAQLMARERIRVSSAEEAIRQTARRIRGAYALVICSPQKLMGVRDPLGLRPLCLGKRKNAWILASESCAITAAGGQFIQDIAPGEILTISKEGLKSESIFPGVSPDHAAPEKAAAKPAGDAAAELVEDAAAELVEDAAAEPVEDAAAELVEDAAAKPAGNTAAEPAETAPVSVGNAGSCAHCVFEYIYFARLDSRLDGVSVYEARKRGGALLARAYPAQADVVAGVPDSGLTAAMGYAEASGIPFTLLFQKNSYVGRTFIKPAQQDREDSVRIKLSVIEPAARGRRIVLVDDSIVRGTTIKNLIRMLKKAGALEVHVRISSPPFLYPCYFGTDVPSNRQLIACHHSAEEIRAEIGADSLGYMPVSALPEMTGGLPLCTACFTGNYPMEVPSQSGKSAGDRQ